MRGILSKFLVQLYELAELKAPETQERQGRGREAEVVVGGKEREEGGIRKEKEMESLTIRPFDKHFLCVSRGHGASVSNLSSPFASLSLSLSFSLSVANMRR